jgi:hypothetical protein
MNITSGPFVPCEPSVSIEPWLQHPGQVSIEPWLQNPCHCGDSPGPIISPGHIGDVLPTLPPIVGGSLVDLLPTLPPMCGQLGDVLSAILGTQVGSEG